MTLRQNLGAPSALQEYFKDLHRFSLLSPEEEVELGRRVRAGDDDAVRQLVEANLRFVVTVAKKFRDRGLPWEDLIAEGNHGLLVAARKFDERRGVKFISYAVWWIRQAILVALNQQTRDIRLPLSQAATVQAIAKATARFRLEHGRDPSTEELADLVGTSTKTIERVRVATQIVALDMPTGEKRDRSIAETIPSDDPEPDTEIANEELSAVLAMALGRLRERDRMAVDLYFGIGSGIPSTLEEVGAVMGITRERARQLRDRGLREMLHGPHTDALASFLA